MEIGSEFSNICLGAIQGEYENWLPEGEDYAFVFSGRTAIESVLRDIGQEPLKVLLPSYCCASMIEPFLNAGYSVEFYEVGLTDGISVKLSVSDDCTVLLWCNYFGFRTDYPQEEICKFRERGGIVIEDITHSLFSGEQYHLHSDYLVASVRKWGALLSGGFCYKMNGRFAEKPKKEPDTSFLRAKKEAMWLKEEYLREDTPEKKVRYLKLFSKSNQWLAEHYSGLAMDEESKRLISGWDAKKIRTARRRNANILYQGLSEYRGMVPLFTVEQMDCPLFVPICIENGKRDEVRQRLIEEEIYCPVHWPRPCAECVSALYETELSLICDQRYNEEDMHRILSVLQKI